MPCLFCPLQAYVVFTKYRGKDQPLTIVQGGTKYMAAPNSTVTHMTESAVTHMTNTESTTNM